MSEEYAKCLKRERDREGKRRKTKQGAFEAEMLSFDRLVDSFEDPSKAATFSDGGAGAEAIIDYCDGVTPESSYEQRREDARNRIEAAHPGWLDVLDLIIENGEDRKESICQMTLSES